MTKDWIVIIACCLSLSNCGGTVISAVNPKTTGPLTGGSPAMQYFLPIGSLSLTASFAKGALTSGIGDKPTIAPDINSGPLYLTYSHEGISTENVTISVGSNGLLQKVSSTSSSQILQLIQGINEILKQYTAFKAAAAAANANGREDGHAKPADLAVACEGLALNATIPVVPGKYVKTAKQVVGTLTCKMTTTVDVAVRDFSVPPTSPPAPQVSLPLGQACEGFVCFRPQSAFSAGVQTSLIVSSSAKDVSSDTRSEPMRKVSFLAPDTRYLGYIRFDRGVFAERTVEADFTDGILTTFTAKRSSELVGFLAIPAAALTTATLVRALH